MIMHPKHINYLAKNFEVGEIGYYKIRYFERSMDKMF